MPEKFEQPIKKAELTDKNFKELVRNISSEEFAAGLGLLEQWEAMSLEEKLKVAKDNTTLIEQLNIIGIHSLDEIKSIIEKTRSVITHCIELVAEKTAPDNHMYS